ncbi:MAG: TolC family protein [Proteobacteria bacterium]|nr:TolC family protein [Pseudomonadota bacterium]
MSRRFFPSAAVLGTAALAFVGGCASYTAKPIVPATMAGALEQRTLADPGLTRLVDTALPQHAGAGSATWDLSTLTLAALYFHPEMEISRSKLALARAGVTTAGQIPNPTLSLDPTRHGVIIDPSPWTVGILLNVVLEIGGKREKRLEQARHLVDAAREDLATAEWQVRGGVRSSLLDLWAAEGRLRLIGQRKAVQAEIVAFLERRFAAGDASALDVARERINLSQARLAERDSERQAADARARLATAIGVPLRALAPVQISLATFDRPAEAPDLAALSAGALRQTALRERTDVLGLLAEYEAAQSALRLEVARQFPNITLGPGYTYDQGDELYTLGLDAELPIFNQNQGPIAEAEARRGAAAARFIALQAKIIGEIDQATERYKAAVRSLATADELVRAQARRRRQIERSVRLGEVDRLARLTADQEQAVVDLARFEALVQQREALAAVEDAVQQPMFDGGGSAPKSGTSTPVRGMPFQPAPGNTGR